MRRTTALVLDLLATMVFVVIGLHSHGHQLTATTVLAVWYPFALGVVATSVVAWRRSANAPHALTTGVVVAVGTVVIGMTVRVLNGQGTAFAFILVALCFLTLFLTGWRFIATRIR